MESGELAWDDDVAREVAARWNVGLRRLVIIWRASSLSRIMGTTRGCARHKVTTPIDGQ